MEEAHSEVEYNKRRAKSINPDVSKYVIKSWMPSPETIQSANPNKVS